MNEDVLGGLYDGTYRARWLRQVIRTPQLTDSIRVLLMTLALHMDASGRVSVPREDLAVLLNRNERKVGEKVKAALESGFLVQTARGQKHQTAVYRAAINGQTLSMAPEGPAESFTLSVSPGGPAENSQGADLYDPEPNPQGVSNRPPEPQGADLRMSPGGPAEDSQVAPRGTSQSFIGVEVAEEIDLSDDSLFEVENAASRQAPKSAKPQKEPKASISADFALTDEMRQWATENCPQVDVDIETKLFIRYWLDRPRTKRPGWLLSWESWMLRQVKWDKGGQSNVRQLRPTGTDSRFTPGSGAHTNRNTTYSENPEDVFGP